MSWSSPKLGLVAGPGSSTEDNSRESNRTLELQNLAFSLLDQDAQFTQEVRRLITGADVFLYAENQLELQSSADDGVDRFSQFFPAMHAWWSLCFGRTGERRNQRNQEHAIKNPEPLTKAANSSLSLSGWTNHRSLYGSIRQDSGRTLPVGKEGLAAVLSELVRARGGIARQPTAEERAAEVNRRRAFASDRTSFLGIFKWRRGGYGIRGHVSKGAGEACPKNWRDVSNVSQSRCWGDSEAQF